MTGPTIAILGATGSVGEALLARLAESALATADISAYASRVMRRESVEFGGRTLHVRPIAEAADSGPALVLSALPSAVAHRTVPTFVSRGSLVIDVGNACAGVFNAPLCLPGVRPLPEAALARAGGARTPSAPQRRISSLVSRYGASVVQTRPARTAQPVAGSSCSKWDSIRVGHATSAAGGK